MRTAMSCALALDTACGNPSRSAALAGLPPPARRQPASTTTRGLPTVSVPVLSITSVSSIAACSSAAASRNSRPCRAARPVATRIAVGVASPSAQGQAITRTAMAWTRPAAGCPSHAQTAAVAMARPTTTGTNIAEILSARRWIGGLAACAARTRRTMLASTVSRPVAVARAMNSTPALSVPAKTVSPAQRSTGRDSPVSMDSSSWARASSNKTPSTGTASPVGTRKRSPIRRLAASTSTQLPSRSTQARRGARSISARRSRLARTRACSSSRLPTRTNAMISTADSK